jgi:hypothetical protein
MFDYQGPRYPYTERGPPNGAVIEALRNFLADIARVLDKDRGAKERDEIEDQKQVQIEDQERLPIKIEKRIPIVILGHVVDPAPPIIARARDTLKGLMEARNDLSVENPTLSDGWLGACEPGLLELAERDAIFVLPVDETVAQLVATRPTMLLDQLQNSAGPGGDAAGLAQFERSVLVYWMPSGIESPLFLQKSRSTREAQGPYFRTGSAEEIAEWLACEMLPEHPAPPIHYEAAPIDDAMQRLSDRLKEALDGIFRPPEPNVVPFLPEEGSLNDELGKMARASGGIFITHEIGIEATSLEVPSELKKRFSTTQKNSANFAPRMD